MTQKNSLMQLSAVDEVLPFNRLLLLGLQHVLVMYAGDIAVPLIVSETPSGLWMAVSRRSSTCGCRENVTAVVEN